MSILKKVLGFAGLAMLTFKNVQSFNFKVDASHKNYLILQNALMDCNNYNTINQKNKKLSALQAEKYCDEDPFCRFFLFNNEKQEIRLCYDKTASLKKPKFEKSWITCIKEEIFENYAPSLVNMQGVCNHSIETYSFNTLKEALQRRKDMNANFMIVNFQSKQNGDGSIEAYFCESIDQFVDRNGFIISDFTKLDKPRQSCLKTKKCGLRGVVQPDDSKYKEGINPGDIVIATKF